MTDSAEAYSLLSPGMRRWVSEQGWPGFRDVQSDAIKTLLGYDEESHPPNIIVSAPTSSGKALADYEPVLTDSGWKPIGDITMADKVYGSDGRLHDILGIFPQGEKEIYRLTLADGRSIDCSADHIWRVIDAAQLPTKEDGFYRNMTTQEMLDAFEPAESSSWRTPLYRFGIPNCQPVVFTEDDEDIELPLRPDTAGILLAREYINADTHLPPEGFGELLFGIPIENWSIPRIYMQASTSQRRTFLHGLLAGGLSATSPSPNGKNDSDTQLIEDAIALARSLGYFVEREGAKIHVWNYDRSYTSIVNIEKTNKTTSMTCISVSAPDHTYIAKDFTVTHNTEAAFLPALSIIENYRNEHPTENFVNLLWVSPLKALLNSSFTRLQSVCSNAEIPCYLWHGDAPQGQKKEMLRNHDGIILTTPESLESFLVNRGEWCSNYMIPLVVVIDEFHSFLGEGRGKQMLSLLDRIDVINAQHGRSPAVRIGLSATLSKLDLVASILSPRAPYAVIDGTGATADTMDIEVKTFTPPIKREGQKNVPKEDLIAIGNDIIEGSVGEKTLTFATSRMQVESIASTINDICKANNIKSEAFPHHGSLAKELREELERRLVNTDVPTMAIATITLELGIDIGDIYKVFQVGAPNSVASLRQRIGRSGRRDGHKRCECLITSSNKPQDMNQDLVNIIAEIELMNAGWFEPPQNKRKDISVLVSEILSVIKQYGSAYEEDLYNLLVERGAFWNIPRDLFGMVVADMISKDFLEQVSGGLLILGLAGERETSDYHFYATFSTEETYSVKQGGKTIGEIMPPDTSLMLLNQGGTFMLGGRYWAVQPPIDMKAKVINVKQIASKAKFLVPTSRGAGEVGGQIKKTAIKLLTGDLREYVPDYLDDESKIALQDARKYAAIHRLNGLGISIYDGGESGSETDSEVAQRAALGYGDQALLNITPPVDAGTYNAIVKILSAAGLEDPSMANIPQWRMNELVETVLSHWDEIEENKENLIDKAMLDDIAGCEKYNWVFSNETLQYAYVDEKIDLPGAKKWLEAYARFAGIR